MHPDTDRPIADAPDGVLLEAIAAPADPLAPIVAGTLAFCLVLLVAARVAAMFVPHTGDPDDLIDLALIIIAGLAPSPIDRRGRR